MVVTALLAVGIPPAEAATLKKTGTGLAYTGPITLRSVSNVSFGSTTCTHSSLTNPASFGYGSFTSSSITAALTQTGVLTKLVFGNPLTNPNTTTNSLVCPSTIPGYPACAVTWPANQPLLTRVNSGVTGAEIHTGPIAIQQLCQSSSGGSPITCRYSSGSPSAPARVIGAIAFNGVNLSFSNQPFYRTSATSPSCPTSSNFSGTYNLFGTTATSTSGGSIAAADRLTVTNP